MPIQAIDTAQIKESIDLRELAARYTELHRESAHELSGPCPKCGGTDRFHCTADWFMCRQCHEKRGDAIEFVMWHNSVDFKEAVAILTSAPLPAALIRRSSAPRRHTEQPVDWQRSAAQRVAQAHQRLMDDNDMEAENGRRYLEHVRKLEPHVWQAFKLGFTPGASLPGTQGKQTAPAIVIPWYRSGKVCAVRYRFLGVQEYSDDEDRQRAEKQTALTGSNFQGTLFGGQALDTGIAQLSTLIICEGELNACSIWQVAHDTHIGVLSLGSESASITPKMADYAKQYARVIVWLDKEERAQAVMTALPGAYGVKSPNGQDANDLLKAGKLGGFLALHRFLAARNAQEQEQLLWDLWDAAQLPVGADDDSMQMIATIANTLGKAL